MFHINRKVVVAGNRQAEIHVALTSWVCSFDSLEGFELQQIRLRSGNVLKIEVRTGLIILVRRVQLSGEVRNW